MQQDKKIRDTIEIFQNIMDPYPDFIGKTSSTLHPGFSTQVNLWL